MHWMTAEAQNMQDMKRRRHVGCEDRGVWQRPERTMALVLLQSALKRILSSYSCYSCHLASNMPQGLDRHWFYIKTRHVKRLGTD